MVRIEGLFLIVPITTVFLISYHLQRGNKGASILIIHIIICSCIISFIKCLVHLSINPFNHFFLHQYEYNTLSSIFHLHHSIVFCDIDISCYPFYSFHYFCYIYQPYPLQLLIQIVE